MRQRTKTQAVARALIKSTGRGHIVFNDRLVDGTRSLKVWGWQVDDYRTAKNMLEVWGCTVDMVQAERYNTRGGRWQTVTRLHVQE
jgi:hypothetical protein